MTSKHAWQTADAAAPQQSCVHDRMGQILLLYLTASVLGAACTSWILRQCLAMSTCTNCRPQYRLNLWFFLKTLTQSGGCRHALLVAWLAKREGAPMG